MECGRGVKRRPEVRGGVMFTGRASVGKALRYVWFYKAHLDGPDPQPHCLSWALARVLSEDSSAQRKLLMMKRNASSVCPSFGRAYGCAACPGRWPQDLPPPALWLRWSPGTGEVAGWHTKVTLLLAGSKTVSCSLGIPKLLAVLHWS